VYLNADVSMAAHVTATVRTCFASLRQICSVRRSLSREALLTLIRALVVSKLDYCNSVLVGVTSVESRRRLRSASTSTLLVPTTRRTTRGDRAFPVAAARAWNALPASARTAESYIAFRRQMKTLLFQASFNDDRT